MEVQGEQHYRYISYFYGTEENFQYQQWKDNYKRKYAEYLGYRLLCLDYPENQSGRYITQINKALQEERTFNI